jgi:CubicO group peptidase (beta-lactamase class C family)
MLEVDGFTTSEFAGVRDAFAANFEANGDIGAAVAVYRHGRPVVDLWGGVADRTTGRAWERDTLQVVMSTTKGVVAGCVHLLAQRGELDLDAPVAKYWPEFAAAGKEEIPVRWPGTKVGYHAMTYGWLVGEAVRRASGRTVGRFLAEEIAGPLGLDLFIGLPAREWPRMSRLVEATRCSPGSGGPSRPDAIRRAGDQYPV